MTYLFLITLAAPVALALFWRGERRTSRYKHARMVDLAAENQYLRTQLARVYGALDRTAGGIDKRLREHAEIEAALRAHAPHLLGVEPGLTHWLAAAHQFLRALRDAAYPAQDIDPAGDPPSPP